VRRSTGGDRPRASRPARGPAGRSSTGPGHVRLGRGGAVMNLREVLELVSLAPPELRSERRRLARAHTIGDLRAAAMRRLPRPVFDYVEGGADEERSLRRNLHAFGQWE